MSVEINKENVTAPDHSTVSEIPLLSDLKITPPNFIRRTYLKALSSVTILNPDISPLYAQKGSSGLSSIGAYVGALGGIYIAGWIYGLALQASNNEPNLKDMLIFLGGGALFGAAAGAVWIK